MSGVKEMSDNKAIVYCFAIVALFACIVTITTGGYYAYKSSNQGARGKANVDIVCNIKTPKHA